MLRFSVSAAVIGYLLSLLDWEKISNLDSAVYGVLFGAAGVAVFCLLMGGVRWAHLVTLQTGERFSIMSAFRGYLLGGFFNVFLPGAIGGDLFRIKYACDKTKISPKLSGVLVISERFFGLASVGLIFGLGLAYNLETFFPAFGNEYFPFACGLAVLGLVGVKFWIARKLSISYGSYVFLMVVTIIAQLANIYICYVLAHQLGLAVRFVELMVVIPLVFIATVLPISLGGLGVREGTLAALLSVVGVPVADGVLLAFLMYVSKTIAAVCGAYEALIFNYSPKSLVTGTEGQTDDASDGTENSEKNAVGKHAKNPINLGETGP